MRRATANRFILQKQSRGFRSGPNNPTDLAIEFRRFWGEVFLQVYDDHFPDIGRVGYNLLSPRATRIFQAEKRILLALSDRESHQGRLVETIETNHAEVHGTISALGMEFSQSVFDNAAALSSKTPIESKLRDDFLIVAIFICQNTVNLGPNFRLSKGQLSNEGLALGRSLHALMDPGNRDEVKALVLEFTVQSLVALSVCKDKDALKALDDYMNSFLSEAKAFVARAKNDELERVRLALFKYICYAITVHNSDLSLSLHSKIPSRDLLLVASEVVLSPYLLTESAHPNRLAEIARKVQSKTVAWAIMENPQWIDPRENFALLGTLITELNVASPSAFAIVNGRPANTAIKVLGKLNDKPQHAGVWTKARVAKVPIDPMDFSTYLLDVADQIDQGEKFADSLHALLPKISPDVAARIVRCATNIYVSNLWAELIRMFESNSSDAFVVLDAIEKGDFDGAKHFLSGRKQDLTEQKEKEFEGKIRARYIGSTDPEIAILCTIYHRMEELKIDPKHFGSLRAKGLKKMVKFAEYSAQLNNAAFRAVLTSSRNPFLRAVENNDCELLISNLNTVGEVCQESELTGTFSLLIHNHLESEKLLRNSTFDRIVIIAGAEVGRTISQRLSEQTSVAVRLVSDERPTIHHLKALLRKGDAVIIDTSHISHSASGAALTLCRKHGIFYVTASTSNTERLLRRLGSRQAA